MSLSQGVSGDPAGTPNTATNGLRDAVLMGAKGVPKYSDSAKKSIQALYESGEFTSVGQLHTHVKNVLQIEPCPTQMTLKAWVTRYGWCKHRNEARIEERKREECIEVFARLGLPFEDVCRTIADAITEARALRRQVIDRLKTESGLSADLARAVVNAVEHRDRSLDAIKEYNKLCGTYAPGKKIVEIDLEKNWMVEQDHACNEAYLRRFGRHPDQQRPGSKDLGKPEN